MSDERNARPVSGEIIEVAAEPAKSGRPAADVIDAEFETLRPGQDDRIVIAAPMAGIGTASAPSLGLDSLRKNEQAAAPAVRSRGGPIFWIVGLALVAGAFWVSGGHALVRQAAPVGETRIQPANPLKITDVTSRIEDHGGRSILFVDGKAVNDSQQEQVLPPIGISVSGNDGQVMRYRLGTSQDTLPPGGHVGFSSRLEAPKDGVKSVSVTFQE